MEKQFVRRVMLLVSGLLVFGFVAIVAQGKRLTDENKTPTDPVYAHGFQVGYTLAKSGAVKPSAAELEAHARRAAMHLKETGGLGFKTQWKSGFDTGWRAGD